MMSDHMKKYSNRHGHSGVTAYEIGADNIQVRFTDNRLYTYSYESAGKSHVEKMKALATEGKGLSTYISRFVKEKYEH